MVYFAKWFTLSNALLKSIAHKLTVSPPLVKRSTLRTDSVYGMITTYPFLKPNWLLLVWRNSVNFSIRYIRYILNLWGDKIKFAKIIAGCDRTLL